MPSRLVPGFVCWCSDVSRVVLISWGADAAVMQKLGINTIRVYNINPAINHDLCVSIFNAVGIYM